MAEETAARSAKPRTRLFRFSVWLGAHLFAPLLRALGATWRITSEGEDLRASSKPFVAAIWHQGLFCGAYHYRDRQLAIPVSRSRDGDRIDAVLRRLGFAASPRGSSSRAGAAALRGMLATFREGHSIAVLCDGPRGPARRCKPGVFAMARATGEPAVPVGIAASPSLRFPSWDRAFLPLPFARVFFVYGPALGIARDASEAEFETQLGEFERRIEAAQQRAEALAGIGVSSDRT